MIHSEADLYQEDREEGGDILAQGSIGGARCWGRGSSVDEDGRVILEFVQNPFLKAAINTYVAKTTVEEYEKESLDEQIEWSGEGER